MEKNKNKIEETEVVVKEEVVTEEKVGLLSKVTAGAKKHGKKIAVGAAALAVGIITCALLKKSGNDADDEFFDYDDEGDFIDVEVSSEETVE